MSKNAFDKIIGYEEIKEELLQICDMIKNRERYEALGAKLPHGVMLYGDPGLGKSLMAKCFIAESGLKSYTIRRNKGNNDFISEISDTFKKAKENAPAVIFLDDLDKFANEDDDHCDAEEYVAVQAGIDDIDGSDVFVIATVNESYKLPQSLKRPGRFDRKINVQSPTESDAVKIIAYYLKNKRIAENVNMTDLTKMISYSSCAELETMLNEAAINAGYLRKDKIEMEDLIRSVLRMQYDSPDNFTKKSQEDLKRTALHEAGHLVASEVLLAESVGLASLRSTGRDSTGGFIHRCKDLPRRPYHIIVSLAGKAAVELYYSDAVASGCYRDIQRAFNMIREAISENATHGFGMIDVATRRFSNTSESMNSRNEAVTQAELERYMVITKNLLLKNRDFLEKTAAALEKQETLLFSDIQKIKSTTSVTPVEV